MGYPLIATRVAVCKGAAIPFDTNVRPLFEAVGIGIRCLLGKSFLRSSQTIKSARSLDLVPAKALKVDDTKEFVIELLLLPDCVEHATASKGKQKREAEDRLYCQTFDLTGHPPGGKTLDVELQRHPSEHEDQLSCSLVLSFPAVTLTQLVEVRRDRDGLHFSKRGPVRYSSTVLTSDDALQRSVAEEVTAEDGVTLDGLDGMVHDAEQLVAALASTEGESAAAGDAIYDASQTSKHANATPDEEPPSAKRQRTAARVDQSRVHTRRSLPQSGGQLMGDLSPSLAIKDPRVTVQGLLT